MFETQHSSLLEYFLFTAPLQSLHFVLIIEKFARAVKWRPTDHGVGIKVSQTNFQRGTVADMRVEQVQSKAAEHLGSKER
jgi:hypothetical protein